MILLDTNVLSALMRDPPDANVVSWLDKQSSEEVWTSAVTVFEVRFGLARIAQGRRRTALEAAFEAMLREDLMGRIASLDRGAADVAGRIAARREAAGRVVDPRDTLIAGIAVSRGASVAPRDAEHFDALEVGVINPWAM